MVANPYGVNGPRMGASHGRLRNSMLNQLSKMSGRRQAYPNAVTARPAPTVALPPAPDGSQTQTTTPFQVATMARPALTLDTPVVPIANATPVLDLSSGTAALGQAAQNLAVLAQLAGTPGPGGGTPGSPAGNPGPRPPVPTGLDDVGANIRLGRWMAANRGWGPDQFKFVNFIVGGHAGIPAESNWLGSADNPTSSAVGIGQRLVTAHPWSSDAEKYHYLHNVQYQIAWMYDYIAQRYGTPEKAWAFKQAHHWY